MVDWGLSSNPNYILEPSCGDGSFIESLSNKEENFECLAVELLEISGISSRAGE